MLQREDPRLLDQLVAELADDTDLALPHRLMRAIFLEVADRPLVKAPLVSDAGVLGALATDKLMVHLADTSRWYRRGVPEQDPLMTMPGAA